MLLCMPRILGYVFNPLSVFYCFDDRNTLRAILYEVHNTFGESHTYVVPVSMDKDTDAIKEHRADKSFYVSPFIGMQATYHFSVVQPDSSMALKIRQTDDDGDLLLASMTGTQSVLTDKNLLRVFFTYPLMTVGVIAAIHWQALRLWLKGARYHGHAASKPAEKTSYEVVRGHLS